MDEGTYCDDRNTFCRFGNPKFASLRINMGGDDDDDTFVVPSKDRMLVSAITIK